MTNHYTDLEIGVVDEWGVFTPGQPVVQRQTSKTFDIVDKYLAQWSGGSILVEAGFKCDLASIPRPLWALIPKSGLHDGPSVIHDWCYKNQWRTRYEADLLFLEAMKVAGSWWLRRNVMFLAVRVFGWIPWDKRTAEVKFQ